MHDPSVIPFHAFAAGLPKLMHFKSAEHPMQAIPCNGSLVLDWSHRQHDNEFVFRQASCEYAA